MANRHSYQSLEDGVLYVENDNIKKTLGVFFRKLKSLGWILAGIIFMISTILLGFMTYKESGNIITDPDLIVASSGAVASELIICSQFGVDVLKEGGNAVDAAIASMLCVGTINAFSAGIGGGGFMLVRLPNGTSEVIDFRETAPGAATEDMFVRDSKLARIGGLSIGIPGEVAGMKLAHEKYGKLSWKRLFEPSINISRDGFPVPPELGIRLEMFRHVIISNPQLAAIYAPNGDVLKQGEILYRTNYSITLEKIADDYTDFYNGSIARSLVKTIKASGGLMTLEDLADYRPVLREPVVGYYHGRKVITTPEPASGAILIFMLNILEGYELNKSSLTGINLHRLVETLKFGFARRTELGDAAFFENKTAHELRILDIISKKYASIVRKNITDDRTHETEYYNPVYAETNDHGTTHLSTVDKDDMAVAFTSTVVDPNTGIILNDQLDDFSIPGGPDIFGMFPSPYNFIAPGKKPLSSTVPTIIEKDGKFEMTLGGSGGTKILTAVLEAFVESGFPFELLNDLVDIGHIIQIANINNRMFSCMVQAVRKFENGTIHGNFGFIQQSFIETFTLRAN
ncbi:15503_t:CDS:10 [Acaulospora morrowiae]|uniref:Glutathione hydrolase n=1 Tax=Acaulospora morrowiae TaxID=94023 RepID=A0A9N9AIP1_9GLOM|nr:15503_t:CDS:10 [Acaulospora morrowiae]